MKLKTINTPIEVSKKLSRHIPEYVIQEREAGRGTVLSYVSGVTVTDILNNTFGPLGWTFETVSEWVQESIPFFDTYAKVPDAEKVSHPSNGKKGAWVNQAPVAWVKGRLIVYVEKEDGSLISVVKEAYGSKSIIGKQSEQEHIFKSAQTDALKKAASLLGIGAQLYRSTEEEQKYFEVLNRPIIWTEEVRSSSVLWDALMQKMHEKNLTLDDLNSYVEYYSEGLYVDIYAFPEQYMQKFIDYIDSIPEEEEDN